MSDRAAWDAAPVGLLLLDRGGTVTDANATFLTWAGRRRQDVVGAVRLPELLSAGGRIYWETHLDPLLRVEGRVEEVALELRCGPARRPVLLTACLDGDVVRVSVVSAAERARYERELLAARRAADLSTSRVRALHEVTAALSRALGVVGVADALLAASVGPLGARGASLWLTDPRGAMRLHGSSGDGGGPRPARTVLHDRHPLQLADRVVVPLRGTSQVHGVLSLAQRTDPAADPLDVTVLAAVGEHAGTALDRAQLYEQSADVARELQHSLLAVAPPADPRYDIATAYRPGVEMLEVGGDWYDVFGGGDGVLSVVVGDVVGRGLPAASAMGQLRSAVRAVAVPAGGPASLLSYLDEFVEQVDAASMATLAYGELDLSTGHLRYACAGHPPPLLLPTDAPPRLLWDGRSPPLGAFVRPSQRDEGQIRLSPGDRLLLYTDGLIERRDRALDDSLDVLTAAATPLADLALPDAVRALTDRLLADERHRDDVCVLLLRWTGAQFERSLPADLRTLSGVRAELGRWLTEHGADLTTCDDVVLASSEAVANAAEHGSGGDPGAHVLLRARVEPAGRGDTVVVEVRDRGQWREPRPGRTAERGRGLTIMRALVDQVQVQPGDGTTVVLRRRMRGAP